MNREDRQMMLELCRRIDRETDPDALSNSIADLLKILQRKLDEVLRDRAPIRSSSE